MIPPSRASISQTRSASPLASRIVLLPSGGSPEKNETFVRAGECGVFTDVRWGLGEHVDCECCGGCYAFCVSNCEPCSVLSEMFVHVRWVRFARCCSVAKIPVMLQIARCGKCYCERCIALEDIGRCLGFRPDFLARCIRCKAVRKVAVWRSERICSRLCRSDGDDLHVPRIDAVDFIRLIARQFECYRLWVSGVNEIVFPRFGEDIPPTVVANRCERIKRWRVCHKRFEECYALGGCRRVARRPFAHQSRSSGCLYVSPCPT